MNEVISAREANQHFSRLLRRVQAGEHIIVTSHGHAVAQISGINDALDEDMEARKTTFLNRLRQKTATPLPQWTRNELYD